MAATVLLPTHNWTTRRHTSNADNQPGSRPPFADPKKKGWTATGVGGDGGGAAWTGEVAAPREAPMWTGRVISAASKPALPQTPAAGSRRRTTAVAGSGEGQPRRARRPPLAQAIVVARCWRRPSPSPVVGGSWRDPAACRPAHRGGPSRRPPAADLQSPLNRLSHPQAFIVAADP
uniref:Uncharacterized protein n=3 Tax=Oryza TaxID=4527 RepID=A0A0D9ZHV3_9ORYZ